MRRLTIVVLIVTLVIGFVAVSSGEISHSPVIELALAQGGNTGA